MSDKLQKIVDHIAELTVTEVADLVKLLEEKFGVSAAVQVAAAGGAATPAADAGEAQDAFNVILVSTGGNKIAVIKALREINPALTLIDAKGLSEKANAEILTAANKTTAEEAKKKLTEAGATVELK